MIRWPSIVIAGLGGVLALALAREVNSAIEWFSDTQPRSPAMPALDMQSTDTGGPALHSGTDTAVILERPLFNWNRRPGQSLGSADSPLPRLAGIFIGNTGRYAIFAALPGSKPQVVQEGSTIGRFVIDQIATDHVVIKTGSASQTLRTHFDAPPPPPMPTPDAS